MCLEQDEGDDENVVRIRRYVCGEIKHGEIIKPRPREKLTVPARQVARTRGTQHSLPINQRVVSCLGLWVLSFVVSWSSRQRLWIQQKYQWKYVHNILYV